jgi:outer membrane receptor protein involved in Fe transport
MTKKLGWLSAASAVLAMVALPTAAQAQQAGTLVDDAVTSAEDIVVVGEIRYRDRSEETAPTLEYGLEYFQRFEPLTAGDALKRVPSVAFLSDVLESDGVRLRGLDPAYTQILINGEQVPGSGSGSGSFGNGADGSFFVDRIPAELIERVEVVRSASANRSGDAVAGAINIVLRDSYSLDGGFVRGGVQYFQNDENWGEVFGGVWGGEALGGRVLAGFNMQDRHNPKDKFSARYPAPGGALANIEDQTDVRDGTDYSGNFSYIAAIGPGEFSLSGFFVKTERYENEDSIEYSNPAPASQTTAGAIRIPTRQITLNDNNVDIDQQSWSLNGGYAFEWGGGETEIGVGYASFTNEEDEFENEIDYLRDAAPFPEADRFTADRTRVSLDDAEWTVKIDHEIDLGDDVEFEFGVDFQSKERESLVAETARWRTGSSGVAALPAGTTLTTATGAGLPTPIPTRAFVAVTGGDTRIERTRIDPWVMLEGENDTFNWEVGLRYETTDTDIQDRTVGGEARSASDEILLPSLHLRYSLTADDRVFASVARTVRRPSFSFLSPALLEAELGDNDFVGNPGLSPETAWGLDIGYERRLGRTGVFGVNVFYRDITDLIELSTETIGGVPVVGSEGSGAFVLTPRNTGDGTVMGIEFDLSTPLTALGLENTGVFVNYSWLDSEVTDEFGDRRFNSQAESVFNIGFIHDIPNTGTAFGATYRAQGDAFDRVIGEEIATSYGADLEIFAEQQIGERFVLRFVGSNLLDASKDEVFDKFTTIADQRGRSYDEYELETESAGPVFQLIGRYAF